MRRDRRDGGPSTCQRCEKSAAVKEVDSKYRGHDFIADLYSRSKTRNPRSGFRTTRGGYIPHTFSLPSLSYKHMPLISLRIAVHFGTPPNTTEIHRNKRECTPGHQGFTTQTREHTGIPPKGMPSAPTGMHRRKTRARQPNVRITPP